MIKHHFILQSKRVFDHKLLGRCDFFMYCLDINQGIITNKSKLAPKQNSNRTTLSIGICVGGTKLKKIVKIQHNNPVPATTQMPIFPPGILYARGCSGCV